MLDTQQAKKVVIHIGEDLTYRKRSAFIAICDYLGRKRIRTANVTRGIAGFGADHHMHTITIERLTENLPIRIEFVAPLHKVDEVIPELYDMVGTGLIEVQDTFLSVPTTPPVEKTLLSRKRQGKAKLLRIFLGETDEWEGKPLFEALLRSMRANGIARVTVYGGIAGYGENRETDHEDIHQAFHDQPVTVVAVDEEDKIQAFLPFLDQMLPRGLVVLSDVEAVRYTHDFCSTERRTSVR